MPKTELLNRIEHVSDVFTRIILRTMEGGPAGGINDEITLSQFQALRHIHQHGPCTVTGLAEGLSISQPAATMLVDRMVKRELVVRRAGSTDRRQSQITLTSKAGELIEQIERERAGRFGKILDLMSEDDRRSLAQSLGKFVAAAVKLEDYAANACLNCGNEHHSDCIVNLARLELSGSPAKTDSD